MQSGHWGWGGTSAVAVAAPGPGRVLLAGNLVLQPTLVGGAGKSWWLLTKLLFLVLAYEKWRGKKASS